MQLKHKPDFEDAQPYWDAFWQHELIDRPCTTIRAPKNRDSKIVEPRLQSVEGDFRDTMNLYDAFLDSHVFLGELIPGFRPGFGPDQFAGFLGAPIVMKPDSPDTSWSEKIVEDWERSMPLKIDRQGRCWQRMHEFHRVACDHYAGKCMIYNIDLHSNIDGLEALRGAQKLLYDLIDHPDLMLEVLNQIRIIFNEIYDNFYQYSQKIQKGSNSVMHLYSRGKTGFLQADFIALLSPEMMRKFVLPAIEGEAAFLDDNCFHLDGPDALKHIDDILAIDDIQAIQWEPGAGNGPNYAWPDVIERIQRAGKAAVLYGNCEEIKAIHGCYQPELVVYDVQAETETQGLELLDWLKKNT